ncbi:MAG TPA: protease modulator HflC [bacterium]|nr:protease modulator HflC [bacterium]
MKKPQLIIIAVVVFIALVAFVSSAFIVNEIEQVIITQFGKPVGGAIVTPGIHFKIPFIQTAHIFDKRFLEWDGNPNQVPTKDKRFIWVDTYARWRIADPLLFFQRVRDEMGAQSRLDDILDGEVRNAIARHDLVELIRSSNRVPQISEDLTAGEQAETFIQIEIGREKITRLILEVAALRTAELGIELFDMRFKRINYVEEVRNKIFDRMISERERVAERFRSEGQGEASKILGDRERDLKEIQSEAYKTAQEIIGKADGEAAAIYAKAYNQSPSAQEFYRFLKTMETYQTALSEKDWLILSTKSDFFKFLQNQSGR